MASDSQPSRSSTEYERAMVSHTTILILSALLIGMVLGRVVDAQMATIAYPLGMLGLVAYLGLGHAARYRRERADESERRRDVRRTESRLVRHVRATQSESIRPHRTPSEPPVSTPQFMPVMRSK